MATGGMTVIRDNFVYLGYGSQAAWGTDVAPTSFWKTRQGTQVQVPQTIQDEQLGDTDIFENFSVKTEQYAELRIAELVQPITVGFGLKALLGTGADTYTAPTFSTTLSTTANAGATALTLVGDPGNTGTKVLILEGGLASSNGEVVTVDCTTRSGTGPWTVTLANGATLKLTHNSASTATTPATHVLTAQGTTYDPCSIEAGIGSSTYGTPARVLRFLDAVGYDWTLDSGPGGAAATAQHGWYAAKQKKIAAWATPAYEAGGVPGSSPMGAPLAHNQATGAWKLASATTGNAASIRSFKPSLKRNTNARALVTEGISPAYFLPGGLLTVDATLEVVFTSWQEYDLAVFGKSAALTADTDSYIIGTEAFEVTYSWDAANTLKFSFPNVRFKAAPPKLFGKGDVVTQQLAMKALKLGGTTPLTVTLTNSYTQAY